MDPINIIVGLNIIATFGANFSGAKKGLKSTVTEVRERPVSYLQRWPLAMATLALAALIFAVFGIGTLTYDPAYYNFRLAGLIVYLLFSWFQIYSYKSLGEYYAQDILIFKNHQIVDKGPYRIIRHPHYMSQILIDIAGGVATLSYVVIVIAAVEIPLIIKRALLEEKILAKHFKDDFSSYKKRTGFMFPFVG